MKRSEPALAKNSWNQTLFALFLGFFFGLALLKFSNPVIFEDKVAAPRDFNEWINEQWPLQWAFVLFIPILILGILNFRWKWLRPKWIFLLPLAWLIWEFIAGTQTISSRLTVPTLKNFSVCVAFFYLGALAFASIPQKSWIWIGILIAFCAAIQRGVDQHFSRAAEREYFMKIDWDNPPPEVREKFSEEQIQVFRSPDFQKRVWGDRISGPLFYPNSFAAAILLFLPILSVLVWNFTRNFRPLIKWFAVGLLILSSLACLFWSGSKSGWLLMLLLISAAILRMRIPKRVKNSIVIALAICGIGGFIYKYSGFFAKGATSVVARGEYWKAAWRIALENPIFGTGPGTFAIPFQKIKPPGAEMARLVHNDYLEQACDSGFLGFLLFLALLIAIFIWLYRYWDRLSPLNFAILLGVSAVLFQSFLEFNLYIPALGWPVFFLLGYLFAVIYNSMDTAAGVD